MAIKERIISAVRNTFPKASKPRQVKSEALASVEETPKFLQEEVKANLEQRNKSRLRYFDRNRLLNQKPYSESMAWYHDTLKYKRRTLGRYGMEALGVPAGVAWPTKEELADIKEYERVAFPLSLQERWEKLREEKKKKEEEIMARQNMIDQKMSKMDKLLGDIQAKIDKKTLEAELAQKRKEERLKEIRNKLRLSGIVSNTKVSEMLEKYEEEDKKKRKAMKKMKKLEWEKSITEKGEEKSKKASESKESLEKE